MRLVKYRYGSFWPDDTAEMQIEGNDDHAQKRKYAERMDTAPKLPKESITRFLSLYGPFCTVDVAEKEDLGSFLFAVVGDG